MTKCRLCGTTQLILVYEGPIRDGGPNASTVDGFCVVRCPECSMAQLDPLPGHLPSFYETHEYRSRWDIDVSAQALQAKYDHEQTERIRRIGIENLRNKVVLDIGASAGIFLDAVKGLAQHTIAVEPADIYEQHLSGVHSEHYAYPQDAIRAGVRADVIVSFDVIEHLAEPRSLIDAAGHLLAPGGTFFLSMPSCDDILLTAASDAFTPFFFQTAHLNYFDAVSVRSLFTETPFNSVAFGYLHKYGLSNLVQWARFRNPGRFTALEDIVPTDLDRHYITALETAGLASHHFIVARKD